MITTIETRVRLRLEEIGMMFKVFCEKIDMSDVAVRGIFKRNDCRLSDLKKMANVLGVSTSYLLGESDEPQKLAVQEENQLKKEVSYLKTEIVYLKEIIRLRDSIEKNQSK
ncbi:MAG: hypothetical protein K0B15_07250 [Lentimicrobium sp.]|nr:hypothetical protein [Lentimicrobium sp.]